MRIFSARRAGAATEGKGMGGLGDLPEWNLADLYSRIDAPELKADIERAGKQAEAFETRWKGKLAEEAD
jgi:oligoendopeptidase F